jgi:hypothetical protein
MTVTTDPRKTGLSELSHIGTYTWAALSALTGVPTGSAATVSDLGYAQMVYNGTRWRPPGGQLVLAQSGAAASVTGTLVETVLATVTVPGGLMGLYGSLLIKATWSVTNSGNTKTMKVVFGGTAFSSIAMTAVNSTPSETFIRNRGSTTNQVGSASAGSLGFTSGGGQILGISNTANDVTLTLNGLLTNIAETITLEGYTVQVLIP